MKVLYDDQIFSYQDFGGISLIYAKITENLRKEKTSSTIKVSALVTTNVNLHSVSPYKTFNLLRKFKSPYTKKLTAKINSLYSKWSIKQNDFDILHPTYYTPYPNKLLDGKITVITFLDMVHELFMNDGLSSKLIEQKRFWAKEATHLIAISENTKKDMVKAYNIDPNKISVTYLAGDNILDPNNFDAGNYAAILPEKYILYDGNRRSNYKNFIPFLRAISSLLGGKNEMHLVCAGGGDFTEIEKELFAELGITDYVVSIPLTNERVMQGIFWANATLYAYPSKYEGFGIPILQSWHMNCPVALSNASCFPEIAQDAGFYFDPESAESMKDTVERALYDKEERKEKNRLAQKRVKDFSWKKTAEKTFSIYESLL